MIAVPPRNRREQLALPAAAVACALLEELRVHPRDIVERRPRLERLDEDAPAAVGGARSQAGRLSKTCGGTGREQYGCVAI